MTAERVVASLAEPPVRRGSGRWLVPRLLAAGLIVALLGLLVWDLAHQTNGSRFVDKIREGRAPPAPAFSRPIIWNHSETWPPALRPRLRDGRLALNELRGYPVVINFWASWCVPCAREARTFAAAARRYAGRIVFVGVDLQDLHGPAQKFLRRHKINYVSVSATDKTTGEYGLTGVPETYYLDARGNAVAHDIGEVTRAELAKAAGLLLKEQR